MPNLSNIVQSALNIAQLVAPMAGPGGVAAGALAAAVQKLLQDTRAQASPQDHAAIDQALKDLQARVNAHADSTIKGLRGG
jgi:hypothetical protein